MKFYLFYEYDENRENCYCGNEDLRLNRDYEELNKEN